MISLMVLGPPALAGFIGYWVAERTRPGSMAYVFSQLFFGAVVGATPFVVAAQTPHNESPISYLGPVIISGVVGAFISLVLRAFLRTKR